VSSAPEPQAEQRPLTELFSTMTTELSTLFRQEVQLARAEVRQEASKAGQAVGILAGGAIAALIAVLILAMAAGFGLAEIMPTGWAFAIVGVVIAIVAAVLVASGRKRLQSVSPKPDQTIETLKEDAQTIRERRP
jgi:acyl-coenzyme A thioesterase PaaI-like protein